MPALTPYTETLLLNALLREAAFVSPSKVYVALFSGDPLLPGTELNVDNAPGYARVALDSANWSAPAEGPVGGGARVASTASVEFPMAEGSWARATYFGMYDAETNGNLLVYGSIGAPKDVVAGDVLRFSAGALSVGLD